MSPIDPTRHDAVSAARSPRRGLEPHHIYLLLAALDVAMLVTSLTIIHRLRVSYGESVETNTYWATRLIECVELSKAAVEVNRPGNEAFLADHDPEVELVHQPARLAAALGDFDARLAALRTALAPRAGELPVDELSASLDAIEAPMNRMVEEAKAIFAQLAAGHETSAGVRMATMDQQYAVVNARIGASTKMISDIQKENLQTQLTEVEARQKMEFALAGVIVLIVVIATIYGTILARRMHRLSNALARYQDHLEALVEERTARLEESQERLRLSDRLASIGTLAAGLGHDMNNVLFPVRCRLDTLKAAALGTAAHDDVDSIRKSVEYLQQLTDGLRLLALDAEEEAAGGGETDISTWWEDVRPLFLTALPRNATLEGEIAADLAAVAVPPHQLTQALFNLVVNAGEASGEGGRVRVWARSGPDADEIRVGVTDTGHGMSAEVQRQARDPFYTTKKRGLSTGLGLALVQRVASSAGGSVEIDSTPGAGTTVVLRLPSANGAAESPSARTVQRALVTVTDDRLASFVTSMLRSSGLRVVDGESDGAEGVRAERPLLWVTDAAGGSLDAAEAFAREAGPRRLILVGEVPESWKHLAATTIEEEGAMRALRQAVGEVLDAAGDSR